MRRVRSDDKTMTDILSMLILYFSLYYIGYIHGRTKR